MIDVYWLGTALPRLAENAWSTGEDAAFRVSVISTDGREYVATIDCCGKRYSSKSASPQLALDSAVDKIKPWALDLTHALRWFTEQTKPKQTGAKFGRYTMAHVPDTPEQAARMAKKRAW